MAHLGSMLAQLHRNVIEQGILRATEFPDDYGMILVYYGRENPG
jgi:hypothetical protein